MALPKNININIDINISINININMKYIGVLRDTASAPKPTTQYNTIQYHAIPFIR